MPAPRACCRGGLGTPGWHPHATGCPSPPRSAWPPVKRGSPRFASHLCCFGCVLAQRLVFDDLTVVGVTDEGLGNTSRVTRIGDRALVVDPERDPLPYQEVAARPNVDIALSADPFPRRLRERDARDAAAGTPENSASSAAGGSIWSHLAVSPGEGVDLVAGSCRPGKRPSSAAWPGSGKNLGHRVAALVGQKPTRSVRRAESRPPS